MPAFIKTEKKNPTVFKITRLEMDIEAARTKVDCLQYY